MKLPFTHFIMNRRYFLKSMVTGVAYLAVPKALISELSPLLDIKNEYTVEMDLDWFSEQWIKPAMYRLVESVDKHIAEKILNGEIEWECQ